MLLSNLTSTSSNKINLNIICKYKIIKRFTGNKPVGHARNILAALKKTTPLSSQVNLPPSAKKLPIEEIPFTEIKTFPEPMANSFTTITPNVVDKREHIAQLKNIILKMIPSTQPKLDNRLTPSESRIIQGKEALSHFLNYFETIPLDQIKSNEFFILFQKELTERDPQIIVRSYQLAFSFKESE